MIKAVDLFCGAGGLTHGLESVGVEVVCGYDIEKACEYAYETNNKSRFINKDVSLVSAEEVKASFEGAAVSLLAGCAPCQPFSRYTSGRDITSDKKWPLMYQFARLINEVQPKIVTMENVPDVVRHSVYTDFVSNLESQGYFVWADKVFCPEFGIPQERRRHVLLASKLGRISLIEPTHSRANFITVRDAIKHLPKLDAGQKSSTDCLHRAASLSKLNLERIRNSKPGGTWRDWPEHLKAACHKKESGSNYRSVYARMSWDSPSPTMTTQCFGYGNGRFGHPEQDRAISLREAAIFQTFPDSYQFYNTTQAPKIIEVGKLIGNAVPVRLGAVIGESVKAHVNQFL
jgi:DNA (cytosine-5)-methyltransferase 1